MSFLSRLFGKTETSAEILCPHCERAMNEGHDVDACARKRMSRRFFFGVMGGAAVAVAVPEVLPDLSDWTVTIETGPSFVSGNVFLTPEMITREMLLILRNKLEDIPKINRAFDRMKIGDTIQVRKPSCFVGGGAGLRPARRGGRGIGA